MRSALSLALFPQQPYQFWGQAPSVSLGTAPQAARVPAQPGQLGGGGLNQTVLSVILAEPPDTGRSLGLRKTFCAFPQREMRYQDPSLQPHETCTSTCESPEMLSSGLRERTPFLPSTRASEKFPSCPSLSTVTPCSDLCSHVFTDKHRAILRMESHNKNFVSVASLTPHCVCEAHHVAYVYLQLGFFVAA